MDRVHHRAPLTASLLIAPLFNTETLNDEGQEVKKRKGTCRKGTEREKGKDRKQNRERKFQRSEMFQCSNTCNESGYEGKT